MKYRGYLRSLASAFQHQFEEISTHHNFDLGDEFEIALCIILRKVLPQRYGVCRGFVVPADGDPAGDDIIIYDHERFPTLRLLSDDGYQRKQDVPVEAVYAYMKLSCQTLSRFLTILNGESENKDEIIKFIRSRFEEDTSLHYVVIQI